MHMPMTPDQITLVQTSFAKIRPMSDTAARAFYARLFARDPSVRNLFVADMHTQGRKLMEMLDIIVTGLPRLDILVPDLQDLGRRHANYGTQDEHYEAVRDALIEMLAQLLGAEFTPDAQIAWSEAYTLIAQVMQAAAAEQSAETGLEQTFDERG